MEFKSATGTDFVDVNRIKSAPQLRKADLMFVEILSELFDLFFQVVPLITGPDQFNTHLSQGESEE
jgi:hypothetical protein